MSASVARLVAYAASQLERSDGPLASRRMASIAAWGGRLYGAIQRSRAPLVLPPDVRAVAIGGATLGGSYKTPLAIAIARRLRERGAAVVYVGHAYGARPECARRVSPSDETSTVGDEALLAARGLEGLSVPVVVAPKRAEAVAFARTLGDVLVIDGTNHVEGGARVVRVLSVCAEAPWGSGRVLPFGDLRAPPGVLTAGADVVVSVASSAASPALKDAAGAVAHTTLPSKSELQGRRVGLLTALARPERVAHALLALGVYPKVILRAPDHRGVAAVAKARQIGERLRLDAWVITEKCSLSLGKYEIGAPHHTLTLDLALSPTLLEGLRVFRDGP